MRALIENYRNLTAGHCGSGSMRNLLYHYCDLDLDESVVFGLGSGLECLYISAPESMPPYMLFGRGVSMERDLASALGVDYREVVEGDDQQAWEVVRDEVLAGRPTMLSGDIYYLDYRKFKVHFPGHRFVLVGFDEDRGEVYVADRTEQEIQTCSMAALSKSRNALDGFTSHNLWGKFHSGDVRNTLPDACGIALKRTTARMLGEDATQIEGMGLLSGTGRAVGGLAGIQAMHDAVATWPHGEAAIPHARYAENCIARFGTGGSFFRQLFAGFISWSKEQRPDLVDQPIVAASRKSAELWDELADLMREVESTGAPEGCWSPAQRVLNEVVEVERQLFERLAGHVN